MLRRGDLTEFLRKLLAGSQSARLSGRVYRGFLVDRQIVSVETAVVIFHDCAGLSVVKFSSVRRTRFLIKCIFDIQYQYIGMDKILNNNVNANAVSNDIVNR